MFTRVIIHAGQITDAQGNTTDLDYIAGNTSGRTLEVSDPNGTQAKANALLAKLQNAKFQYQPYRADKALLDPAAELGDGISISDTYSGIYKRDLTFSSLMAADLEAPSDEEIEHEFPYIPKADREYKRETQYTRSQLKINANEISSEVSRASGAEGQLSTRITQNANSITAEISNRQSADNQLSTRITANATAITTEVTNRQKGDSDLSSQITQTASSINAEVSKKVNATNGTATGSSFAWSLTASGHYWYANKSSTPVMSVTSSGLTVRGNITATSGYIGNGSSGFEIGNTCIRNGMASLSDTTNNGIYLGTDGIALGKGAFKATKNGDLTATKGVIGGWTISASALYKNLSSLTGTTAGIYLGTNGIRVYKDAKNNFTLTASNGRMALLSGMTSRDDTANTTGMYIGYDGIALGGGKFKVTNAGKLTASDVTITGGSFKITKTENNTTTTVFEVSTAGRLTATSGTVGGLSMSATQLYKSTQAPANGYQYGFELNSPSSPSESSTAIGVWKRKYTNGTADSKEYPFKVTYGGALSLGNNFKVDTSGNVTANNMTLKGQLKMQDASGSTTKYINADTLAQYATNGNSANSWINADVGGGETRGSYCVGGAYAGYSAEGSWGAASDASRGVNYIRANTLNAASQFIFAGASATWRWVSDLGFYVLATFGEG